MLTSKPTKKEQPKNWLQVSRPKKIGVHFAPEMERLGTQGETTLQQNLSIRNNIPFVPGYSGRTNRVPSCGMRGVEPGTSPFQAPFQAQH